MDTCRKQSNDNGYKNKVTTCQLKLQGNKKILISSSNHQSTGSGSDFPAMNTRSKSVKRINPHSQQIQHREKKMKISNINKIPEKELALLVKEADIVQSTENSSPINILIDDCLEEVFMYLSPEERLKNELVCKKWRSINRLLLKKVQKLDYHYIEPNWKRVQKLTGGNFFWYESLHRFKKRFNYVPRLLQLTGQYVRELDLSALNNSIILTKLKKVSFPHLIKLKLRFYLWDYMRTEFKQREGWNAKHCDNVFDKMTKLESLHLTIDYRYCIPLNFIIAMLSLSHTLKELSVVNCTYHRYTKEKDLIDAFWSGKDGYYYLPMLSEFKSLNFLELKGFYLDRTDCEALKHFNLKKLVLAKSFLDTVDALFPIFDAKNLEELSLGPCEDNIDAFLNEIPNNLKNLTKLVLFQPNATAHRINVISSIKKFQTFIVNENDRKELAKIIYT